MGVYALDGIGFVPHSVFVDDYVARGLERGLAFAAFSAGAVCGPTLTGWRPTASVSATPSAW